MKQKWKWLGLCGLGVVGCALAGGYYYYQQLTYLPDWYEADSEFQEFNQEFNAEFNPTNPQGEVLTANARTSDSEENPIKQELQAILEERDRALASSPTTETESTESTTKTNPTATSSAGNWQQDFTTRLNNQTIVEPSTPSPETANSNSRVDPSLSPTLPNREVDVTLNQGQIRQIIGEDRQLSEKNRAFLESTQGVRANINEEQLNLGAVVSVADVPLHLLSPDKRRIAEKVLQSNPALRNRSVYVSLESNYDIENGQVKINGNTQISVGNMRFSLREVARRSGVSQSQIERLINQQLNSQLRYLDNF